MTITGAYIRDKSMRITHRMACKDSDASIFKFSKFPYLKDVTLKTYRGLVEAAEYRLTPLLANNPDPGRSLRKITLIASMLHYHDLSEEYKQDYARKLQNDILSKPYKDVQFEFRVMHTKINLVAETEKYVRQEFLRVLGENAEPQV